MSRPEDEDPLLKPASDAGWNDAPAASVSGAPVVTAGEPVVPAPAATAGELSAPAPAVVPARRDPIAKLDDSIAKHRAAAQLDAAAELDAAARLDALIAKKRAAVSDAAKPGAAKPDAAEPDAAKPDAAKPDAAEPDAAEPDVAEPGAAKPDAAKPDAAIAKIDAAAAQLSAAAAARTATADEPLLPAKYDENELRAAVGASPIAPPQRASRKPRVDDDDELDEPRAPHNRKAIALVTAGAVGLLGIAALVILGRLNSDRYLLACEAERAVPEQGRSFPPWGTHGLAGDAWKPLKITPETRCQPHETDDPQILTRAYLVMVLDQATALLSAREVTRVDDADALLKQALLLTRPPEHESEALTTERTEHHKEVERLLGDVAYWRASARLREATTALSDAAKQFEAAAAQHPRHVSDAPAWASYARKVAGELKTGPLGALAPGAAVPVPAASSDGAVSTGVTPPATAPADHADIPLGVALPVEPARPTASPGAAAPVAPPPDAGVPTGGVLL